MHVDKTAEMRFAVSAPNVGDPNALVQLAVDAEAAGWDAFFLWDHLHLVRAMALDVDDPWVVLGAIAHATERIKLGAMVTPVARRRPWKLAKELVTLDHLSGGRTIVGVGLGFPADDEFGAFGDTTDDRVRADLLDEGLAIIDAVLRGEPVRHDGKHFHVDADLRPGARQQPRPPIWVAAMWPNKRPMARAARYDGVDVISADGQPLPPSLVREVVDHIGRGDGFDIVAGYAYGHTVAEYEDAGATWLVDSRWPSDGWYDELAAAVRSGPPQ